MRFLCALVNLVAAKHENAPRLQTGCCAWSRILYVSVGLHADHLSCISDREADKTLAGNYNSANTGRHSQHTISNTSGSKGRIYNCTKVKNTLLLELHHRSIADITQKHYWHNLSYLPFLAEFSILWGPPPPDHLPILTQTHTNTHTSQALPQVAVDSVLVAVALEVSDDANLKGLRSQEVPQHIQDTCSLKKKLKKRWK